MDEEEKFNCLKSNVTDHGSIKPDEYRFVEQLSDAWFSIRSQFPCSGSTAYAGLGLETLVKQRAHIDKVSGDLETPVTEAMIHGTESEIHAKATLLRNIMPWCLPDVNYYEEGV